MSFVCPLSVTRSSCERSRRRGCDWSFYKRRLPAFRPVRMLPRADTALRPAPTRRSWPQLASEPFPNVLPWNIGRNRVRGVDQHEFAIGRPQVAHGIACRSNVSVGLANDMSQN